MDRGAPGTSFLDYWFIILKWRWVVLGAIGCALLVGGAATMLMTPIYTATAVLQIDREAAKIIDDRTSRPMSLGETEQFYQTQYGLLKSRSLAERVVDTLNLASDPAFLSPRRRGLLAKLHRTAGPALSARPYAQRRRMAIGRVMDGFRVIPERNSRLVQISFDNPDPQVAARIVNAMADGFINWNLERRFQASAYARKFLEDHLAQEKQKLEDSERQLVAYATQQGIIQVTSAPSGAEKGAPGQGESLNDASLRVMNDALSKAKTDRLLAQQKWENAEGAAAMSLPEVLQSAAIQTLRSRRTDLSSQYEDKLKLYKPDFPAMVQLKAQMDETDRQIKAQVADIRGSLRQQYEIALKQEQSLETQVNGLKASEMDLRNRSIRYEILQREVDTNRSLYDALLQRYKEIGVAGGVGTNNIAVVDSALTPPRPRRPNVRLNMMLALASGLLAGILIAFGLEYIDDSIKTPEDIEAKLGAPMLGSIPSLSRGASAKEALADHRSQLSEAYYSVRTALQFSTDTGAPSSFLVTSARPAEGKSTTATALAQSFARLGLRVLLIDADLRNPSLHHYIGCDNSVGLSNFLVGALALADIVQPTNFANLSLIPCGQLPPNPAELLARGAFRNLIGQAEDTFDLVIVDGPPVMGLADAPLLASAVAGAVMVVEAGTTRRGLALAALKRLSLGHAHLLGAVLTKFHPAKAGYGSYGYGYNYAYNYAYGSRESKIEDLR